MTRKECLDAAAKAVLTDRAREYGHPEDCFGLIAALWSRYTERDISSADVAVMMILLKLARIEGNPRHVDSWVDIAGYAACGAECAAAMSGCERVGGVDYGAGLGRIARVKAAEDIPSTGSFGHGDIPVKTM